MSPNENVRNVLDDRKEDVVKTPLSENKSLTKDVEKGNDKLADILLMEKKPSTKDVDKGTDVFSDIEHAVSTIFRKGLYQFYGQSSGSKV